MDEIDAIVIQVLGQIGCSIDDEVTSLAQFTPEMLVAVTSRCLRSINPDLEADLPSSLPAGMAQRYAVTQKLAECIKEVGFRGDVGYQTLLYANTIEVRRVLMFLVEKLPKDTDKTVLPTEDDDRVTAKEREIGSEIASQLESPWVPSFCRHSVFAGRSQKPVAFRPRKLMVPFVTQREVTEEIKEYWRRHSPTIFQQTTKADLVPSIIHASDQLQHGLRASSSYDSLKRVESGLSKSSSVVSLKSSEQRLITELTRHMEEGEETRELDELTETIEQLKKTVEGSVSELQEGSAEVEALNERIRQVEGNIDVAESAKRTEDRLEILLEDPENSEERLLERISGSEGKMEKLRQQWEEHKAPVQEQLDEARRKYGEKDKKILTEIERIRSTHESLVEDLRAKATLHAKLLKELDKVDRSTTRAAYTSRILEIIGNIRKQDTDISHILHDTRKLQKEINTIGGHLDRQFTATDDLVFRSAKHDEFAKQAYKLLATLHADCGDLVALVEETGTIRREVRELEDQIDMERAKNVAANLERIEADLSEIKNSHTC